jgi:hypothetical protein
LCLHLYVYAIRKCVCVLIVLIGHTGRTQCEHRGKYRSNALISKGLQRIASRSHTVGERTDSPSESLEGPNLVNVLISDIKPSKLSSRETFQKRTGSKPCKPPYLYFVPSFGLKLNAEPSGYCHLKVKTAMTF